MEEYKWIKHKGSPTLTARHCRDLIEAIDEVCTELGEVEPLILIRNKIVACNGDSKGVFINAPRGHSATPDPKE